LPPPVRPVIRRLVRLAMIVGGLVVIVMAIVGPVTAATSDLRGEGDSWAVPMFDQFVVKGAGASAPFLPTYFGGISGGEEQARQDLASGSADFAVTGVPLSTTDLATATQNGRSVAYAPYAAGAVDIVASIPGCGTPAGFHLTVGTLAKIFVGAISSWADSTIASENPTLNLPQCAGGGINRVVRIDSSSTTSALISLFLSDSSAKGTWNTYAVARGLQPNVVYDAWPTESSPSIRELDSGDSGVLANIAFNGGIGYASSGWVASPAYAFTPIPLQNTAQQASGQFVAPTAASVTKALSQAATLDATTNLVTLTLSNINDPTAYPAPMISYLALPTSGLRTSPVSGTSQDKAAALGAFAEYILSSQGQSDVNATGFTPLPTAMVTASLKVAQVVADQASTGTATTTSTLTSTSTSSSTSTTTTSTVSTTTTTATAGTSTASTSAVGGVSGNAASAAATDASATLPVTGGGSVPVALLGVVLVVGGQFGGRIFRRSRRA